MMISNYLQQAMNFTYTLRLPPDGQYGGKLPNGSWSGMVNELIQNRSDMIVVDLTITQERSQVISYVKTLFNTKYRLIIDTPGDSINLLTYITPFHYWVWAAIFTLLLILLPILMYVSTRYVFNIQVL